MASQWQKTAVSRGAFGKGASITYIQRIRHLEGTSKDTLHQTSKKINEIPAMPYIFKIHILVINVKQIPISGSSFEPQLTPRGKSVNRLVQEDHKKWDWSNRWKLKLETSTIFNNFSVRDPFINSMQQSHSSGKLRDYYIGVLFTLFYLGYSDTILKWNLSYYSTKIERITDKNTTNNHIF